MPCRFLSDKKGEERLKLLQRRPVQRSNEVIDELRKTRASESPLTGTLREIDRGLDDSIVRVVIVKMKEMK